MAPLLPRNKNLLGHARLLRREMTPQERRLWYEFLRGFPMKFYRQRVVGNFIVDFYCASFKLAVEVDGGQHCDEAVVKYDLERTKFLNSLGRETGFEVRKMTVCKGRGFDVQRKS